MGLCFFGWRLMTAKKRKGNLDRSKFEKSDEEAKAKASLRQSAVRQLAPPAKILPNLGKVYVEAQAEAARRFGPKTSATKLMIQNWENRRSGAQTHQPGGREGLVAGAKRLMAIMEAKGLCDGYGIIDARSDAYEAESPPLPEDRPPEGSDED